MALMLCFAGRDYRTGEMERGAEREMHMRVTVCRISDQWVRDLDCDMEKLSTQRAYDGTCGEIKESLRYQQLIILIPKASQK